MTVHFMLLVSLCIVKQVVEHGQCIRVKIIKHNAVISFQSFAINIFLRASKFVSSFISVPDVYPITVNGITISFAGKAKIKAISIIPSRPISRANGSRKSAQIFNIDTESICTFAIIQIINPAGAATDTARPKTKSVLSKTDRAITLLICGFLNGGSSSEKDDGTPFKHVFVRIFDTKSVMKIPKQITAVKIKVDITFDEKFEETKKMEIIEINIGKRPLQGTKEFVKIAVNRSLSESIILLPVTPAALHPKPIQIVNACLPHVLIF